jgi:head-tail adaptor
MFAMGSVSRVKWFSSGGKRFADDEEVETEVRKWLRQQPNDYYAGVVDARVKRRDKCINVGGGYVEK